MTARELPVRPARNNRVKKKRGLLRGIRRACRGDADFLERIQADWCNFAHIHLDWYGDGDFSRAGRMLFLREYARRFVLFAQKFSEQKREFQLWIHIHPDDSGADSLYFHTPNPHTEFPIALPAFIWETPAEHLFSTLLPGYSFFEGESDNGASLIYYARGVGSPLAPKTREASVRMGESARQTSRAGSHLTECDGND